VDSFAEAWLDELGVSRDFGGAISSDKLEEFGRQLASARVVKTKKPRDGQTDVVRRI
jgi:hypothetical protein